MSSIDSIVDELSSYSEFHAKKCTEIINDKGLSEALEYCSSQHISPPQCSLTAESKNADMLRAKATRMLCDVKWWKRRLSNQGAQRFEHEKIKKGNVTRFISDEALEYQLNKRCRR